MRPCCFRRNDPYNRCLLYALDVPAGVFEKTNETTAGFRDLNALETVTIIPVVVLILIMGIYPQPFLKKVVPAAQEQIAAIKMVEKSVAGLVFLQVEQEQSQDKLRPGD